MKKLIILTMAIIAFSANAQKNSNPEQWSDKEINAWFDKHEWLNGWNTQPDASVNKRILAIQYFKNKNCWNKVFQFLKSSDLKNIAVGQHEIEGNKAYAIVSEYSSKEKEKTRYESHRKYIDIQYLISGKELMGLTTTDKVEIAEPYNEGKDITFYTYEGGNYILATPSNFLVFFPEDIHRPSVKAGENELVKKIIVKILIE